MASPAFQTSHGYGRTYSSKKGHGPRPCLWPNAIALGMWCHLRSARGSYTRDQRFNHQKLEARGQGANTRGQGPEVPQPEADPPPRPPLWPKVYLLAAHTSSAASPWHPAPKAFGLCFFYHAFPSLPVHPRSFHSPPIHPLFISFPSISPSFISCTNMLLIALYIYIYIYIVELLP